MIEEVKRAIDNNDVNKLYACGFFIDSSIKEYILNNKKRIINSILDLKLWLDDEIALVYFNDNDFIKASIMASNVDVARLFNNTEVNRFLINNMDRIIDFIDKKIYFISDKTPKVLLNNYNFVNLCLDNGFLNVLDYGFDNGYYLKNKDRINKVCFEKIIKGIVKIDEFCSKRMFLNSDFLIGSVMGNNYNVLLFSSNSYLDKYLSDNIDKLRDKLEDFIRSNNYFINKNVDIKLPFFLKFYKDLINEDIYEFSLLFKMMDNAEFCHFVSFLTDDVILDFFGKRINQLYLYFGSSLFELGYDNICLINSFSITEFERFFKIFCYSGSIKMENVRNMYFNILRDEFKDNCKFNFSVCYDIEEMINKEGILNDYVLNKIDELKDILGNSYYDYLVSLLDDSFDVNKSSNLLINDIFDSYRRACISLNDERKEKIHNIILSLFDCAYEREFDLFAGSKMNFNDGYPFLVEPSDIFVKRVYKDSRLKKVKLDFLNDKKKLDILCMEIYDGNGSYSSFVNDVKKYLKDNVCNIFDLNVRIDNYLSKFISNVIVDNIDISYNNLPLTDEYLKTSYNIKTILSVLKGVDFKKLRFILNDKYLEFKDLFLDKQVLYMIDTFSIMGSFYNVSNTVSLINNFCLVSGNIYEMFNSCIKYDSVPSIFNSILGDSYNFYKNDSSIIGELMKRAYRCIKKRSLPVPDIERKYRINNHDITVSIGGYDYSDVFLPLVVNSDVFVSLKYDWLHNYVFSNENGFIIKFYDNKLIGIVYGIRYGNSLFLSNLACVVHLNYVMASLEKFVSSLVQECKGKRDNLGHVYLSNYGDSSRIFRRVNGLINGKTDFDDCGSALYDNLSKINSHALRKYGINPKIYKGDDAYKRAYDIAILDLFGNNEEYLVNDIKMNNVKCAGRSWYKIDDIFVAGVIDDSIVSELALVRKR